MWIGSSSLTEATQKNLLGHLGHRHQVWVIIWQKNTTRNVQNNAKRALPHQLVKQYFKHLFCASLRCWADASDGEDEQIFRSFAANFQISLSPMSLELAKHSNTCRNMLDLYGLVILVIFGFQFWESSYLWFLNGLQGQREVRRPRRQKRYLSDPVCIDIIWWLRSFVDLEDATKCRGHDDLSVQFRFI